MPQIPFELVNPDTHLANSVALLPVPGYTAGQIMWKVGQCPRERTLVDRRFSQQTSSLNKHNPAEARVGQDIQYNTEIRLTEILVSPNKLQQEAPSTFIDVIRTTRNTN